MDNLDLHDLEFDDLPSMDEFLALIDSDTRPLVISPVPTINQTPYSEKISIRIPHCVLTALKAQAQARGMRYQTFINLILSQHLWRRG